MKEDILPKDEFASVGPNYNDRLCEFVINHWNIERAETSSGSLKKAIKHLSMFEMTYI